MPTVSPVLPRLLVLVLSSFHLLFMVMLSSFTINMAAVAVPDMFTSSLICIAEDSEELMALVMNVLAVNVPATVSPSATSTAVLSDEIMVLVTNEFAVNVPETLRPSLM
jgi:hypothetical protein